MQIGALIVAAGMSKRMGEFKPMLSIGSISVAQRVVAYHNSQLVRPGGGAADAAELSAH